MKRIDESIKAEDCIDKIILFNSYSVWANNKSIVYLFPKSGSSFLAELEKRHSYDENGNFNPSSVSVGGYMETIKIDLQKVAVSEIKDLRLFGMRRGYKPELD